MRFLVDANVLVYAVAADSAGERCRQILAAVAMGEADGVCSTAIMEEVWHLELSGRIAGMEGQTQRAYELISPLLPITDETFSRALAIEAEAIGANDRIHAATCMQHGISGILSADRGFDELESPARIDPLDPEALKKLSTS